MKKLIAIITLMFIVACGGNDKSSKQTNLDYMKPGSTGRINHVIVVVEDNIWKGSAGEALRNVIKKPVEGLPQKESQFNVSTIPATAFTKMFKNSRNLLFLQLADSKVLKSSTNKYALPQTILEVKAPTVDELVSMIETKADEIVSTFRDGDLKTIQEDAAKNKIKNKINTLSELGVTMDIPKKYRVVMDTLGSFMWMRSHIAGGIANGDQTNNIIVYEAPMFNANQPVLAQIIKNRDSIGKAYIRGNDTETMYMITEAARVPSISIKTIDGKKAYESRGTWEVFNAFSAGPFLNYSIIDEKNNRVLVVEGFNYAPSVNKRDFLFELEAILKTTKIN